MYTVDDFRKMPLGTKIYLRKIITIYEPSYKDASLWMNQKIIEQEYKFIGNYDQEFRAVMLENINGWQSHELLSEYGLSWVAWESKKAMELEALL